ncbi:MAG: flagellar biosynthesis protein FlhF [Ignavibacteriaceae bacterium]
MQIKKYLAPTLKQASTQMKDELGGDAVILGTQVIYDEDQYGTKKMFEITAGIEEEKKVFEFPGSRDKKINTASKENFSDELKKLSDRIFINPSSRKNLPSADENNFKQTSIKKIPVQVLEKELKEIVDTLYHREVQRHVLTSIINQLKKFNGFLDASNLENYVLSSISSMIPTYKFEVNKNNKPKKVALVGPTGVGKTTCIAKLAVISKILHNLNVGLISIDTYRLGALDQLRIFSEVSNIDMLVAYEPSDIPRLMNSFKNKDIIFIDTAGRSQKNTEHLTKAKEFLTAGKVDETYLVLSATGTTKNLFDVADKFKLFDYNSVIFTKIDEAVAYGNILNIVANFDVPVSFLTNGQVIPDDIISADPEFISNMIYTGKIN